MEVNFQTIFQRDGILEYGITIHFSVCYMWNIIKQAPLCICSLCLSPLCKPCLCMFVGARFIHLFHPIVLHWSWRCVLSSASWQLTRATIREIECTLRDKKGDITGNAYEYESNDMCNSWSNLTLEMCGCLARKHGQSTIFKNFCKPRDGKIEKGTKRGFPEEIHDQSNKESPK